MYMPARMVEFCIQKGANMQRTAKIFMNNLADCPVASEDFMEGVEDLPVQEREP